jgi:ATP-dependent DNA helicase RecQ
MEQHLCSHLKIDEIRNFQLSCLQFIQDKKNCFVSYPTGSGKSLCYEAYPLFFNLHPVTDCVGIIVIVIEPLIAIMNEQVKRLSSFGFSAISIEEGFSEDQLADIASGKFTFIFSNPERLLGESYWRDVLTSSCYQQHRILLVIDEVHTAVEW